MQADRTDTGVATIVAADAVDKLVALDTIATAVGSRIVGAGTPTPTVPLADGVWAQIEIPKFGEPPPLAIDVHATAGLDAARAHARTLADTLANATPWSLSLMFEG
ncbi:hypothetical protein [Microbacterium thalassium]|uniref:Uncharacterized protein n=1 Tax=Microbacterium thalassium TaxID=362649 RepID=A0A7X0FT74_9MICO|nr:hypothetical protein [Microbacterium thalassium]MBB6392740.1 hypothetical protein [Microbacterium thalassium]GLK23028.1 hypothetical protein GCM10017607_03460 [Microbacterium thalassium]